MVGTAAFRTTDGIIKDQIKYIIREIHNFIRKVVAEGYISIRDLYIVVMEKMGK